MENNKEIEDLKMVLKNTTAALGYAIQFVPENEILLPKLTVTLAAAKSKLNETKNKKTPQNWRAAKG